MNKTLTKAGLFAAILFTIAVAGTGCIKGSSSTPAVVPVLTTAEVIKDAADTSANTGGVITETLTYATTAYGVCWSTTNSTPTTSDTKTSDTVNLYHFASKMNGLKVNTKYYVRAYATNSAGTGYGNVIEFTTGTDLSAKVGTVTTLAGNASSALTDGTGDGAAFYSPQGITIDKTGNLLIADAFNSAIRTVTTAGVVTTLAGDGTIGYADGPLTDARFYAPQGLVTDATGNIYIADFSNNLIRKITPAGVVSTLAGSGAADYVDGTGVAAGFNNPRGIAIDAAGANLYVADRGNNLIRKIVIATGVVTTFAGTRAASHVDNVTATSAAFNKPSGITMDAAGNLYIADSQSFAIRKITAAGIVTTLLGDYKHKIVGTPSAVNIDAKGNLFIADLNGRVFEVTTNKVLIPLAGKSSTAAFADGSGTAALFSSPQGLAADASGNLYVADASNNRIRKIVLPTF